MIEIISTIECPIWVAYPNQYLELINNEKDEFLPWRLIDKDYIIYRLKDLKTLYKRDLFPFARKDQTDYIACWEKGQEEKVFIIEDFQDFGWEQREIFENFSEWYTWALKQDYPKMHLNLFQELLKKPTLCQEMYSTFYEELLENPSTHKLYKELLQSPDLFEKLSLKLYEGFYKK